MMVNAKQEVIESLFIAHGPNTKAIGARVAGLLGWPTLEARQFESLIVLQFTRFKHFSLAHHSHPEATLNRYPLVPQDSQQKSMVAPHTDLAPTSGHSDRPAQNTCPEFIHRFDIGLICMAYTQLFDVQHDVRNASTSTRICAVEGHLGCPRMNIESVDTEYHSLKWKCHMDISRHYPP